MDTTGCSTDCLDDSSGDQGRLVLVSGTKQIHAYAPAMMRSLDKDFFLTLDMPALAGGGNPVISCSF